MSVINKMLRDLDQRQAASAGAGGLTTPVAEGRPLHADTPPSKATRSYWHVSLWLLGGAVVVAAAVVLLTPFGPSWIQPWWQDRAVSVAPPSAVLTVPMAQAPVAAPDVQPDPAPHASADPQVSTAPEPHGTAAQPNGLRMELSLRLQNLLGAPSVKLAAGVPTPADAVTAAQPGAAKPVVSATPASPAPSAGNSNPAASLASAAPSSTHAPLSAAPAVASATVNNPSAVEAVSPQRQAQAARDAMAQAQSLWTSGAHDAAVDTLQELLGSVERLAVANPSAANNQLLVATVRELTRMQMALGRTAAAWEVLARLEPALQNHADLWAVRANAAQRLGRHADSVHAYTAALHTRPNEQRWLLGAAVSLAALGQGTEAAAMAEKARQQGPISKDIAAYLRQAGVVVKE